MTATLLALLRHKSRRRRGRAPAGRGPTDARHSRHARSRSHHGHRASTVTPESLQAAGKNSIMETLNRGRFLALTRHGHPYAVRDRTATIPTHHAQRLSVRFRRSRSITSTKYSLLPWATVLNFYRNHTCDKNNGGGPGRHGLVMRAAGWPRMCGRVRGVYLRRMPPLTPRESDEYIYLCP